MNKTWIVMCPNWKSEDHVNKPHGWLLPKESLSKVENRYFDPVIKCIVCDCEFSLQQGLKEAFSSDNPFIVHHFQYNAIESGKVEITVEQLKTVKFSEPFEDIPEVYLTPSFPVAAVPGYITSVQFSIFSCDVGAQNKTGERSWTAYGNRGYAAIPIWRKLLSNSKKYQLRKDFRAELVELESAFEVFVSEFLGRSLRSKLRGETINWLLKRSIEEVLKVGFTELMGRPLSKLEPEAYARWQRSVKELRDFIVHRGAFVSDEQAREAREAVFDLMTRIDPKTIDYFAVEVEKVRSKHPNMSFGTATIKGRGNKAANRAS